MSWKSAFGIREATAAAESDEHHQSLSGQSSIARQTSHPQSHNQIQRMAMGYHARGHVDEQKPLQTHVQRTIIPSTPFDSRPDVWVSGLGDRMGIALLLLSSLFMMQSFAIFVILYKLLSAGL